jgi:hypothetical protein
VSGVEGNGHRTVPPGGFGPFQALSTMTYVQRAGMDSAAQVIERLLDLLGGEPSPAATEPDAGPPLAAGSDVPELRRSVARALDLYSELVRRSFEGYADLVEQTLRVRGVRLHAGEDVQAGPLALACAPGGRASVAVWLHNTTTAPAATALRLTDLTAHDGSIVPGSAGRFDPADVRVEPGASSSATLVLDPGDAAPGTYVGHVLAEGLPDAALPVHLSVTPGGAG